MFKVDQETLDRWEKDYPGIGDNIRHYEEAELPECRHCRSKDTAKISCGIVGRSILVCAGTTKIKLLPNKPETGTYFCNACRQSFD